MKKTVCFIATAASMASAFAGQAATESTQPALQGDVLSTSEFWIAGKSYSLPRLRRADGAICQTYVSAVENVDGVAKPTMAQWCDKQLSFRVQLKSPQHYEFVRVASSGIGQTGIVSRGSGTDLLDVTVRPIEVKSDGHVHVAVSYFYDAGGARKDGSAELDLMPSEPQALFAVGDLQATISLDK